MKKEDLGRLLAAAQEGGRKVFAPVEGGTGPASGTGPAFAEVQAGRGVVLEYGNPALSAKGIFFPQREALCRFHGERTAEASLPQTPLLVFGARPCDARALTFLDKVFGDRLFRDPYYLARREKALVIGLACGHPGETCLCTSFGGSPAGRQGSDILAFDLGEELLFEAATDKGRELLGAQASLFREAGEAELEARRGIEEKAESALGEHPLRGLEGLKEKLDRSFEDPQWERLTRACLGCGACTYLCPTCHCFDITDEEREGLRLRSWDSCQYPLFTLHASGHNPRVNKKQRMRQRIMHKFSYTVERSGEVFCVGCGRCIRACPVNLDMREILAALARK